jgi:hypothetical protein
MAESRETSGLRMLKKEPPKGGSKVVSQGGVKKSGQEPLASKAGQFDNGPETLIDG